MSNLKKLRKGVAVGGQKGFAASFNDLVDFAEKLEGAGNIKVDKSNWPNVRITLSSENPQPTPGGIPAGYEEETLNIVCDGKIVTRKVLVETASKADVTTWGSGDNRKLLQVGTNGTLLVDKGYLKS